MKQVITGGVGKTIAITSNKTYFPYIAEIKDKTIKYIDVFFDMTDADGNWIYADPFFFEVSFVRKGTNDIFIDRLAACNLFPELRLGQRIYIGEKIDMEQSFITTLSQVGENAFFVFYYQDSEAGYEEKSSPIRIEPNEATVSFRQNFFEDSRVLVNKKFTGIYPSLVESDERGTQNLFNLTKGYDSYINLVKGSNVFLKNVPVVALLRYFYWLGYLEFADVEIDFTNSWISVPPSIVSADAGKAMVMSFEYK